MNKDNFSKSTAILAILGSIILVIISSYLAIGEITKFKNVKEILQIIISIVSLFATFGGAYLGAKISGQYTLNSIELENKKRQDKIDKIIRYKATLAIIKIEDNVEVINKKLQYALEDNDKKNLDSSKSICDNFIMPIKELIEYENIRDSNIEIYIAIQKYISVGNRLANYCMQSYDYDSPQFDNEMIRNSYRDYYLTQEEIANRKSYCNHHHYIAESLMIYNTLIKKLELLKKNVLDYEIYNSIHKIEGELYEVRFY